MRPAATCRPWGGPWTPCASAASRQGNTDWEQGRGGGTAAERQRCHASDTHPAGATHAQPPTGQPPQPAPPPPSLPQKHCALNLMRGLQIVAGPGEGEVEVAHLTPSWVVRPGGLGRTVCFCLQRVLWGAAWPGAGHEGACTGRGPPLPLPRLSMPASGSSHVPHPLPRPHHGKQMRHFTLSERFAAGRETRMSRRCDQGTTADGPHECTCAGEGRQASPASRNPPIAPCRSSCLSALPSSALSSETQGHAAGRAAGSGPGPRARPPARRHLVAGPAARWVAGHKGVGASLPPLNVQRPATQP